MKFVLNGCFGGFSLSDEAYKFFGLASSHSDINRQNPLLIEKVEQNSEWVSGDCAELYVVEVPDTCTDWEIDEYDGLESLIYVVDGKIHHA